MRTCLIALLVVSTFISFAQTGQAKIFKTASYISGIFYRHAYDTIKVTHETIDVYFFTQNFHSPYYLPEKFTDNPYKNKKISVWHDPKGKKDLQKNRENTYTYDSTGRVINYTYSGCVVCSGFPYNYTVIYNSKGQVEQIFNTVAAKDKFKFFYNDKGSIVKFEKYSEDKLEIVITVLN